LRVGGIEAAIAVFITNTHRSRGAELALQPVKYVTHLEGLDVEESLFGLHFLGHDGSAVEHCGLRKERLQKFSRAFARAAVKGLISDNAGVCCFRWTFRDCGPYRRAGEKQNCQCRYNTMHLLIPHKKLR
jgi:hypothetical protein